MTGWCPSRSATETPSSSELPPTVLSLYSMVTPTYSIITDDLENQRAFNRNLCGDKTQLFASLGSSLGQKAEAMKKKDPSLGPQLDEEVQRFVKEVQILRQLKVDHGI